MKENNTKIVQFDENLVVGWKRFFRIPEPIFSIV